MLESENFIIVCWWEVSRMCYCLYQRYFWLIFLFENKHWLLMPLSITNIGGCENSFCWFIKIIGLKLRYILTNRQCRWKCLNFDVSLKLDSSKQIYLFYELLQILIKLVIIETSCLYMWTYLYIYLTIIVVTDECPNRLFFQEITTQTSDMCSYFKRRVS